MRILNCTRDAEVAELADAQASGACGRKVVGVQIPPSAPAFSLARVLRTSKARLQSPQFPWIFSSYCHVVPDVCIFAIGDTHLGGYAVNHTRKNLMVDAPKVRALAKRLRTSESAAVRTAVQQMLAAEEILVHLEALRRRGTFGRNSANG